MVINIAVRAEDEYLVFPVVPEEFSFDGGEPTPFAVEVLGSGTVNYPNGTDLETIGWSSFFPARYDSGYCAVPDLLEVSEYCDKLNNWKHEGAMLQLVIPELNINQAMRIQSFTWITRGSECDAYYDIVFEEYREIGTLQISASATTIGDIADLLSSPDALPGTLIKVDSLVQFKGGDVFKTATAKTRKAKKKAAKCVVTKVMDAKHPYYVKSYSGASVSGWVNESTCTLL